MKFSYKLFFSFMLIIGILLILYNNFSIQNYTEPKYKLVVVAIFKNEAVAMKEWLQHYVNQGVEHFYMINNGSTDNWEPEIEGFPVTIYNDDKPHKQKEHYNNYCLKEVKNNAKWVMVVDLDEFMYARNGFKTIPEYLDSLGEDIKQIHVRWKMFGSNGHIKQPKSIIKGFTKRKDSGDTHVKSISCTKDLVELDAHTHNVSGDKSLPCPNSLFDDGKLPENGNILLPLKNTKIELEKSPLHLNHYVIQSWNWYKNVKMTRGDVATGKDTGKGTLKFFKTQDRNDLVDTELSNMTT